MSNETTYEDEDGVWVVDGPVRYLIEPSEAFEAKRPPPAPPAEPAPHVVWRWTAPGLSYVVPATD